MRRLGIVDIGSNTIRLVVYARQTSGGFRLQDDVRERVRLGAGAYPRGTIAPERLARATALLRRFADYARGARLDDLEVIGTSALRDTDNGPELLAAARDMDLAVTVLSGEDEARYGVSAVANGFDLDDAWVMDLGGGSAQISRMEERRYVRGGAHPLGAVRLTEAFLADDPPTEAQVAALEAAVASALDPIAEAMRRGGEPLVAMGGSVRNLARAIQKEQRYPLDLLHGYWLERDDLERLTTRLLTLPAGRRARIAGIHPDRGDVIVAAALVYRWLLRAGGHDGLLISGLGVREGVLFRHVLRPPHLVPVVGAAAVDNLMEQYGVDNEHAAQVRRLAAQLFAALAPLHGLGPRDLLLLDAAAALREIGLSIRFYRRQSHAAFLLRAAPLDGFTHREQVLIMLMVRYHRKGTVRLGVWQRLLADDDRPRLLRLIACLRLAGSLDRSRGGRVDEVALTASERELVLELPVESADSIELWDLQWHREIVAKAFDRRLEVKPVTSRRRRRDPRERPAYDRVYRS